MHPKSATGAGRPPRLGRRELFTSVVLALGGLLAAGCPRREGASGPARRSSGGSMYRSY